MKANQSVFLEVRGLRYHCRVWGPQNAPKLFLLHGWMDCSASFQFLVDELQGDWCAIAPDWRGFGLTDWSAEESYWYPDYLADLDAILRHFQPESPVNLVGHSLGGNVAACFAGTRPGRVAKFVNLEGFGLAKNEPRDAPAHYAQWLDGLAPEARLRDYDSFDSLAARLRESNSRLKQERADFLARHWGRQMDSGRVVLRVDPRHKRGSPLPFRLDEAMACWRSIAAPVLWVEGAESENFARHRLDPGDHAARKASFRNRRECTLPGAGHMLHHEQPERLAVLIEDFLRQALPRRAS
jgi:pimeloyl-ACP methyl ester carboxylesterase